jgi:hypothetical protein
MDRGIEPMSGEEGFAVRRECEQGRAKPSQPHRHLGLLRSRGRVPQANVLWAAGGQHLAVGRKPQAEYPESMSLELPQFPARGEVVQVDDVLIARYRQHLAVGREGQEPSLPASWKMAQQSSGGQVPDTDRSIPEGTTGNQGLAVGAWDQGSDGAALAEMDGADAPDGLRRQRITEGIDALGGTQRSRAQRQQENQPSFVRKRSDGSAAAKSE